MGAYVFEDYNISAYYGDIRWKYVNFDPNISEQTNTFTYLVTHRRGTCGITDRETTNNDNNI